MIVAVAVVDARPYGLDGTFAMRVGWRTPEDIPALDAPRRLGTTEVHRFYYLAPSC